MAKKLRRAGQTRVALREEDGGARGGAVGSQEVGEFLP